MKKTICTFCNLARKNNLSLNHLSYNQIFYKSKIFFCVYNIKPILPGHSLVISKRHVKSFFELKDAEVIELFKVLRKATRALMKAYNSDGFNIAIQEGEVAGQSIEHFHIHIIPRKKGDMKGDPSRWFINLLESGSLKIISEKDMNNNVNKIKRVIKWTTKA